MKLKIKKLILVIENFCYINLSLLSLNLYYVIIFLVSLKFNQGFVFWILFVAQIFYFGFWLSRNIKFQLTIFSLIYLLWDCPLSIIIGKLGMGKTLLLTYLSRVMKLLTENIYSNYPIEEKGVKVLTFNNLDFKDRKKIIPPDDSLILFDESFLYLDGTSPDKEKEKHSGKIPWIVGARHLKHRAIFTAQREGMLWNNIRQLSNSILIPLHLKKPKRSKNKLFSIFNQSFILTLGFFQDIADYQAWKEKSVERLADGKRTRYKSSDGLGIRFFKIIIPLEIANKYDSYWLSFIRDLKNDEITNKEEFYWVDIFKLTNKERLDLFDIDILKKNLEPQKEKTKNKKGKKYYD